MRRPLEPICAPRPRADRVVNTGTGQGCENSKVALAASTRPRQSAKAGNQPDGCDPEARPISSICPGLAPSKGTEISTWQRRNPPTRPCREKPPGPGQRGAYERRSLGSPGSCPSTRLPPAWLTASCTTLSSWLPNTELPHARSQNEWRTPLSQGLLAMPEVGLAPAHQAEAHFQMSLRLRQRSS